MNFKEYFEDHQKQIDNTLRKILPPVNTFPEQLHEVIHYSLFAGGKRLRPVLVLASCEAVGGVSEKCLPFAGAVELIHTYSLIHDDLPSMDNDDYRRGCLTAHKKFGEANAILAGDALLTEAFYILSSFCKSEKEKALGCQIIQDLSFAAGSRGMVGGQVLDLALQGRKEVTPEMLQRLHQHKTGALISVSVRIGALIGEATDQQLKALEAYGQRVGLAFQITDDILDIEGTQAELGKSVGKDKTAHKTTFPDVIGLDGSKKLQKELVGQALDALAIFDRQADPLRAIGRYSIERKK
ncbi:MAG: polyprenyl synthetase family protein [Nitrospirae bacterium]|nr:polyprenyl synthetase family protein [Nitrospirota bacterium]